MITQQQLFNALHYCNVEGRHICLGTFTEKEHAIAARSEAEKLHFGEFLRQ